MKVKILSFIEFILAIVAVLSGIANFYVGYRWIGLFDFIASGFCFWAGVYNIILYHNSKKKR